jgi:uncharacterized protein YdhG (YjbR/CyaY superfamily)
LNAVESYIKSAPPIAQAHLKTMRDLIHKLLPNVEEAIKWQMPTPLYKGNLIHYAAHKHHLGIYPRPKAIEHFKDRLSEFSTTKGAIQIPYKQKFPKQLIKDIVLFRIKEQDAEQ